MGERIETVSDFGEIRLLNEIILPSVTSGKNSLNDDCAHLTITGKALLWSMDPCPTPVANWFGKATPEVWGCYTAAINLSDIAASGGTPLGMLVSIEIPDNTPVSFIKGFQVGLLSMLNSVGANLYGGNVKSSKNSLLRELLLESQVKLLSLEKPPLARFLCILLGHVAIFGLPS